MSANQAATIYGSSPKRVPLAQRERLRAAAAAGASAALPAAPSAPAAATAWGTRPCSAPKTPEGPGPVCPRRAAACEPYPPAAYSQSMPQRAREPERLLPEENQPLPARRRYLEQPRYGNKTQSATAKDSRAAGRAPTVGTPGSTPARPRGPPRHQPGPPRRAYGHLPGAEECHDRADAHQQCPGGGWPCALFPGTQDSTVLAIDVRPPRRLLHRRRYPPPGPGPAPRGIRPAAGPAQLIPQSLWGVSSGVAVLLDQ